MTCNNTEMSDSVFVEKNEKKQVTKIVKSKKNNQPIVYVVSISTYISLETNDSDVSIEKIFMDKDNAIACAKKLALQIKNDANEFLVIENYKMYTVDDDAILEIIVSTIDDLDSRPFDDSVDDGSNKFVVRVEAKKLE